MNEASLVHKDTKQQAEKHAKTKPQKELLPQELPRPPEKRRPPKQHDSNDEKEPGQKVEKELQSWESGDQLGSQDF